MSTRDDDHGKRQYKSPPGSLGVRDPQMVEAAVGGLRALAGRMKVRRWTSGGRLATIRRLTCWTSPMLQTYGSGKCM
eukprot:6398889-Pyramimonas_sp.AAC.1